MSDSTNVRVLTPLGKIVGEYVIDETKRDRHGLITLRNNQTNNIIRVHKSRIIGVDDEVVLDEVVTKSVVNKIEKQNQIIDLDELSNICDLWICDNIEFNGSTNVKTLCTIFIKHKRYIMFNIYNMSAGKKGKPLPFDGILDGEEVGYELKDINKLHKKLISKNYKKYGT